MCESVSKVYCCIYASSWCLGCMVPFGELIFALGKMFVGILQSVRGCSKTETALRQVQGLCFPGSLSLGYLGCIFFYSTLYWHNLSSKVFVCFVSFGFPYCFQSQSNVCLPCTRTVVIVRGEYQFWFTFFLWCRFRGITTYCQAMSSLWLFT